MKVKMDVKTYGIILGGLISIGIVRLIFKNKEIKQREAEAEMIKKTTQNFMNNFHTGLLCDVQKQLNTKEEEP